MNELPYAESSRRHLESLSEHPHSPRFNFQSSDLLDSAGLAEVKRFELAERLFWAVGQVPEWVHELTRRVFRTVPYYRQMGDPPTDFQAVPPISRAELAHHPELLIPDDVGLDGLTVYTTSGTTGTSLKVPTDAPLSSKTLVLMDNLMSGHGARLERGPGKVAVAALFYQDETLTYPSLSHYLQGAATLKVNLHPQGWRDPGDRERYLMDCNPSVLTGCPFSLRVVSELAPELAPLAIFSSATALSEGLRARLSDLYGCPVFDIYSLTEAKFIAARSGGREWDLVAPDLYVEILDAEGRPLPGGIRGEIAVTSGRNAYLPLLRYRTGDFAALEFRGSQPYLCDLQGRGEVRLTNGKGESIPSLDVVNALKELPLVGFSFTQSPDRSFSLTYCGEVVPQKVKAALEDGTGLTRGEVVKVETWTGKPHQFLE